MENTDSKDNENSATDFDSLNIKPDMDANSWDGGMDNTDSKDNENSATDFDSLNIKPDMDANSWDGGMDNTDSKDNENSATNFDSVNIQPDMDANSWDDDTDKTNSKYNDNNYVHYNSLNIKLEVDSINNTHVNTVKEENRFEASTIKPAIESNDYANYANTETSSAYSSNLHLKQEYCININSNVLTTSAIKLEPKIKAESELCQCK